MSQRAHNREVSPEMEEGTMRDRNDSVVELLHSRSKNIDQMRSEIDFIMNMVYLFFLSKDRSRTRGKFTPITSSHGYRWEVENDTRGEFQRIRLRVISPRLPSASIRGDIAYQSLVETKMEDVRDVCLCLDELVRGMMDMFPDFYHHCQVILESGRPI